MPPKTESAPELDEELEDDDDEDDGDEDGYDDEQPLFDPDEAGR